MPHTLPFNNKSMCIQNSNIKKKIIIIVSLKQQMYFALVRPHLEFACAVWDPYTTSDIQKLEGIQCRAAQFMAKDYRRAEGTVTNILQELQWPSLEQRRQQIRLSIMNKIHQDIAIPIPDYIHHVHRQTAQTKQYHPQRFRTMKANSNTYKYSYFPRTITQWNVLSPNFCIWLYDCWVFWTVLKCVMYFVTHDVDLFSTGATNHLS